MRRLVADRLVFLYWNIGAGEWAVRSTWNNDHLDQISSNIFHVKSRL
jgi:hypothetical protein